MWIFKEWYVEPLLDQMFKEWYVESLQVLAVAPVPFRIVIMRAGLDPVGPIGVIAQGIISHVYTYWNSPNNLLAQPRSTIDK